MKYVALLKTRCGCTRFIEHGRQPPYPVYEVMLSPKVDINQMDLWPLTGLPTTAQPTRRRFQHTGERADMDGVVVLTYEEVPE